MTFKSLGSQLNLSLAAIGTLATVVACLTVNSIMQARMQQGVQSKAQELIARTAQMFMVSTIKFNDQFTTADNPADKAKIHADWMRTITAVDQAVTNDFGDKQSRVRLYTNAGIVGLNGFGGEATAAQRGFETETLTAFTKGQGPITQWDAQRYQIGVPLKSDMHPGCANCHGVSTDSSTLLGGLSVTVPLSELNAQRIINTVWICSSLIVALATTLLAVTWLMRRRVIKPLKQLNDHTQAASVQLAQGKANTQFPIVGKYEINAISGSFNHLLAVAKGLVDNLTSNSQQVHHAAQETANMAGQQQQAASLQQHNISSVLDSLTHLQQAGHLVSERADSTSATSAQVMEQVNTGKQAMDLTLETIHALAREVQQAGEVVTSLDQRSDSIGSIISTIDGIAEQTNLLALNAAIEAARAGEQGRGFAVVSDEVRSLAQRTQQATAEINQLIQALQGDARTASQVMSRGAEQATLTVDNARNTQQQLDSINDEMANINSLNQEIASAVDDQSTTIGDINTHLQSISEKAVHSVESADQMAAHSDHLKGLSEKMNQG
ncbi:MAG: methyl-accepting chemotaxis protein [Pseudomonadales bacterium]